MNYMQNVLFLTNVHATYHEPNKYATCQMG